MYSVQTEHIELTKKSLSYFGLLTKKMSWSDKETPVPMFSTPRPKELINN